MLDMYFQFLWYDFIFGTIATTAVVLVYLVYVVIYYFTHRQTASKRLRKSRSMQDPAPVPAPESICPPEMEHALPWTRSIIDALPPIDKEASKEVADFLNSRYGFKPHTKEERDRRYGRG
jgi:hypothetical protein